MITGFPPRPDAPAAVEFRCPGETYAISRSVHLARLAAGYAKCRQCAHRPGAHVIGAETPERETATVPAPGVPRSLFTAEGVRGVYLNEIDRPVAAELAGAFASCLWDTIPQTVPAAPIERQSAEPAPPLDTESDEGMRLLPAHAIGPTVVIGHDERPCAPDLITGIALALKRMGCQVVDVGLTTRPAFWFAAEHLQAVGGVHVTGAGRGPAWTGLDFVHGGAIPCSRDGMLDRIQERHRAGYARVSRRSGLLRSFRADVPYEAALWRHFHALRPLRIACACPSRAVRDGLMRVFQKLACRLIPVDCPTRERRAPGPDDAETERIAGAIREHDAHLGLFVDDDGQRTVFFDETGRRTAPRHVALLLAHLLQPEFPGRAMLASQPDVVSSNGWWSVCSTLPESCAVEMRRRNAVLAADDGDRYWFAEGFPTCDAIVTLARVLQVLSRSDAPFSAVCRAAESV